MKVQQLTIKRFRGIKSLDWKLPTNQRLITLIGPGDTGKSTILEAIHYLLGDRWSIPFADTDFFGVEVSEPIVIKAVLTDLPVELLKESAFGLWLSGVDADGELHQDPEDGLEPCLVAKLSVDETLEPKWAVERVDGESQPLSSGQRKAFSTFKVDDRTDAQLRWTRTSALGRMSAKDGGEREALAAASRAAREALDGHESLALTDVARKVQERANKIGGGHFAGIRPGIDTSRSSMGANLALYEDVVPLTSFGLGSRRLASLAVQQLAAGSRAVAVIDELESGLEPHRAVRLLSYLDSDEYSQVVVTTHSPVIVEQAPLESLAVVQNHEGAVSITSLGDASELVQRLRRGRPSALLARRVIAAEGKTEQGVSLALLDAWDVERVRSGLTTSAGEGVAVQDCIGGSEVPLRAAAMAAMGYDVVTLMDNDDRSVDRHVTAAEAASVVVVRWDVGMNTEQQICSELDADGLSKLLQLGVELRSTEDTVLADVNFADPEHPVSSLQVDDWIADGITLGAARGRIAKAMVTRKWAKDVDAGRLLGDWLVENQGTLALGEVFEKLNRVKDFIYRRVETEAASPADGADG